VTRWRISVALVLALLVGVPLAWPLADLLADPSGWAGLGQGGRLLSLAGNTGLLVAGTLLLSLPAGVAAAVLLYRTDLPGRQALRRLVILTLFVPLPLFTTGWQSALAPAGWAPWGQGLFAAAWAHAAAGLPWVILLAGQGLLGVERDLEEDAWAAAPGWRVVLRVTLPRARAAVAAAAVWVGLQTATEITVTDVLQVRTFAEEVYTQFVAKDRAVLGRAVAVSLPGVALTALLLVALAGRWERRLRPGESAVAEPLLFPLGRLRLPLALLAAAAGACFAGPPLVGLVWHAGLAGEPTAWSPPALLSNLRLVARAEWRLLLHSVLVAAAAGVACAALGLVACWAALGAARFRTAVLVLMAVAWATPGPVIGFGLTRVIDVALRLTGAPRPLAVALWYGPSYVPVLWVDLIRFFPCAAALLWPALRLLPRDLRDAARVDGATPGQELRHVVWPLSAAAAGRAAVAVGVLSLGELSAGKLVSTPSAPTYAEVVFTQMHYGVTATLAAQCLLLLGLVAAGAAVLAAAKRG
jgi:iron(III) transport system permease protein